MTEATTGATGTQADPASQPPAGTSPTQADGEQAEQATSQPESISLDEAKKLRSEAASLRRRLNELEAKDKAAEEAKLSESEKTAKRLAELERDLAERDRQIQEQTVRTAAVTAAAKLGFANPDVAFRLLDFAAIEFDEAGHPRNVDALLGSLAKAEPYLVRQAAVGSADTGLGGGRQSPRSFTRDQLRDPKFYAENREAIQQAANEGRIQ